VLPSGGYAISHFPSEGGDIVRVGPDNIVQGAFKPTAFDDIQHLAADRAGNLLFTAAPKQGFMDRLVRLDETGRATIVAGGGGAHFFGTTDGGPARDADLGAEDISDVAVGPDGGIFLAQAGNRVRWIAPDAPTRLAVAITRESLRSVARYAISVRSTLPATATVSVLSPSGSALATATGRLHDGLTTLRVPRRRVPPGLYEVAITAQSADGQRAGGTHRLLLGGLLPTAVAKKYAYAESGEGTTPGCRRHGRVRVDCVVDREVCGSNDCFDSCYVASFTLRPSGVVWERTYRRIENACPKKPLRWINRRAKGQSRAIQADPL
jgi:hypothetical protein